MKQSAQVCSQFYEVFSTVNFRCSESASLPLGIDDWCTEHSVFQKWHGIVGNLYLGFQAYQLKQGDSKCSIVTPWNCPACEVSLAEPVWNTNHCNNLRVGSTWSTWEFCPLAIFCGLTQQAAKHDRHLLSPPHTLQEWGEGKKNKANDAQSAGSGKTTLMPSHSLSIGSHPPVLLLSTAM